MFKLFNPSKSKVFIILSLLIFSMSYLTVFAASNSVDNNTTTKEDSQKDGRLTAISEGFDIPENVLADAFSLFSLVGEDPESAESVFSVQGRQLTDTKSSPRTNTKTNKRKTNQVGESLKPAPKITDDETLLDINEITSELLSKDIKTSKDASKNNSALPLLLAVIGSAALATSFQSKQSSNKTDMSEAINYNGVMYVPYSTDYDEIEIARREAGGESGLTGYGTLYYQDMVWVMSFENRCKISP